MYDPRAPLAKSQWEPSESLLGGGEQGSLSCPLPGSLPHLVLSLTCVMQNHLWGSASAGRTQPTVPLHGGRGRVDGGHCRAHPAACPCLPAPGISLVTCHRSPVPSGPHFPHKL